jgi:hypothetical protein
MIKTIIATLIATLFVSSVYAQTAPTAPTQAAAPAITTAATTRFAAGVTAALGASTTNIIYLEQTGTAPTVSINQDGNSNRAGATAAGATNSMILNGNTQVVTIDQTGNSNLINTMKMMRSKHMKMSIDNMIVTCMYICILLALEHNTYNHM